MHVENKIIWKLEHDTRLTKHGSVLHRIKHDFYCVTSENHLKTGSGTPIKLKSRLSATLEQAHDHVGGPL